MPRLVYATFKNTGDALLVNPGDDPYEIIEDFNLPQLLFPWYDDLGRLWIRRVGDFLDPQFREELNQKLESAFPRKGDYFRGLLTKDLSYHVHRLYCVVRSRAETDKHPRIAQH